MKVGQILKGTVNRITEFGAFISLENGREGILLIVDITWGCIRHPSEKLSLGDEISVEIMGINPKDGIVQLGMKQLLENPWNRYSVGMKIRGQISEIRDYGVFVTLDQEHSIKGLLHKLDHPEILSDLGVQNEVEVIISEIDVSRSRILLKLMAVIRDNS